MQRTAKVIQPVLVSILLIMLLAPLVACRPEPEVPQTARVLIIDPTAESSRTSNSVTIKTFVERFDLVDSTGRSNSPGKGHIVYYMDVTPPIHQGESVLTEEGTYVISTEISHTWNDVRPGEHTFWVQLANNDNTPLQPPAAVRVYVTVE